MELGDHYRRLRGKFVAVIWSRVAYAARGANTRGSLVNARALEIAIVIQGTLEAL